MHAYINISKYKKYSKSLSDKETTVEINMSKCKLMHIFYMNNTFLHWKI